MSHGVRIEGTRFVCTRTNRVLQLRGVSLSGNCKIPADLPSHHPDLDHVFDHENVSYVGRPFPLEDMHEHLQRIKDWGFRVLRLVVTWEALEHAGWQKYDREYIEYIKTIVEALPKYGLRCIIDAHQDVFSRLTGGSGAPGWVLETLGFSMRTLHDSHAAHLHSLALDPSKDPPPSVWPTGYQKLAAATCNTVFWAGDIFAYKLRAPDGSGRGLSSFLQEAMVNAFGELADALEDCEAVLGFEPMNEPHRGYLELHSLYTFDPNTDLQLGYHPSALQSFAIGDGYPQTIPYYKPSFPQPTTISHYVTVNETKVRAWSPENRCIWREHGVWDWNHKKQVAVPLRHHYFEEDPRTGGPYEWYRDAWIPFLKKFSARVRSETRGDSSSRREWMTFAAGIPNEFTPPWPAESQPPNFVSAPHFYDLHSLFTKSFGNVTFNVQGLSRGMFPLKAIYLGREGARDNYSLQIGNIVRASDANTARPCIIGEIGIPYDMNGFQAPKTQDWRWQERQIDALCTGLERAGTNYILWNYNADNADDHGDSWYGENFSLYSRSLPPDIGHDGGRCIDAFQRPYAIATAGTPIWTSFDMFTLSFEHQFQNFDEEAGHALKDDDDASERNVTEIYLPRRRYAETLKLHPESVIVSDGAWAYDSETQILSWTHSRTESEYVHWLLIEVEDARFWKEKPANIDLSHLPFGSIFRTPREWLQRTKTRYLTWTALALAVSVGTMQRMDRDSLLFILFRAIFCLCTALILIIAPALAF